MGKTHLSGLEIGDPSVGQWAAVQQTIRLKFTALAPTQRERVAVPDGAWILNVRILTVAMTLGVGTIKLGTASGLSDIFTALTVAGTPTVVEKAAPAGTMWVELSTGATPLYVLITYIPGPLTP